MARHRHTINVRADGLQIVLGPLLRDGRVTSAALVDIDSGMVLDAWSAQLGRSDLEVLGAAHAELMRIALGLPDGPGEGGYEIVLARGDGRHHVLRLVPDPHGDRLALSVVVDGPRRVLERTRRRLRVVSASALTAGPTVSRRPGVGGWQPAVTPAPASSRPPPPGPEPAAPWPAAAPDAGPAQAPVSRPLPAPRPAPPGPGPANRSPAPPSALAPGPRRPTR